ncbi:MAG: hypothetical protein PVH88_08510 [Ignavibacteria bacterium]|jgi:hypothetical protein
MIEENQINLLSFKVQLSENGSFEIPVEEMRQIYNSGIDKVTVTISASPNKLNKISGIDNELFQKIKNKQSLPSDVVYNFLNCKGKLSKSRFKEKLNLE